ncbi:hypothetical protein SAMN05444483_1061 [Salegentibacter echinorum]|uniref:Uncharacterized protein n=1 Tax=Salegentibacter echinorum TaxID=1073325 RepID=A0A1M5HUI6_SALEC|nr:hypothetical protein [Salegentibacter echinorum]SHG19578.1 hypothetical protein SAMN05444483_1061 [Salegentibacter echinorum]
MKDEAMKWIKRAVILKVGNAILKKPASALGIGVLAAGAGYVTYNLITKQCKKSPNKIEDIENNNPEIAGEKKIVV